MAKKNETTTPAAEKAQTATINERALAKGGDAHLFRLRPLRGRPLGHDSAAAQRAMTFHDDPSSTLASRPPIP